MAVFALRRLAEKLGVLDSSRGTGTANTAVAFHAGRVGRAGKGMVALGPAPHAHPILSPLATVCKPVGGAS